MAKAERPPLVQMMLDSLAKTHRYRDDVPLEWRKDDYGMEQALIEYVEKLEKRPQRRTKKVSKPKEK